MPSRVARPPAPVKQVVDLGPVVEGAVASLRGRAGLQAVTLDVDLAAAPADGAARPAPAQLFGAPDRIQLRTVVISAVVSGCPLGICEPIKHGPLPCSFQIR